MPMNTDLHSQHSPKASRTTLTNQDHDPYTHIVGEVREPPITVPGRFRFLGPSVIVAGSIVGSGEILLTSGLGANAGFILLWWVLVSCWSKSVVQAELARYCITTGDTYMRALNRIPGKIPGPRGRVGWPVWIAIIAFIPGITGLGGIVGGAGQGLSLLFDGIDPYVAAGIVAGLAMIILGTGSYRYLERIMLLLVMCFTATTIFCAGLMQTTEFAMTLDDFTSGFTFSFPIEYAALAIAMYGFTGVNGGEIAAYTYWCVEKGYPSYIGRHEGSESWLKRAKGWIKVLHVDVWTTLIILTLATVPFYLLGAGVLHPTGQRPEGLETISVLSNMFTATLGNWSVWLFGFGAFCILFSTTLSGVGAGGRVFPDYVIEFGFIHRSKISRRYWTRGYVLIIPVLAFFLYMFYSRPIVLVMISAFFAAITLPIQSGAAIWLQRNHMDERVRPKLVMRLALKATFVFQLLMAGFVIWFTFSEVW